MPDPDIGVINLGIGLSKLETSAETSVEASAEFQQNLIRILVIKLGIIFQDGIQKKGRQKKTPGNSLRIFPAVQKQDEHEQYPFGTL